MSRKTLGDQIECRGNESFLLGSVVGWGPIRNREDAQHIQTLAEEKSELRARCESANFCMTASVNHYSH